ncbi:hypothetical protein R1flu_017094 [Riccia fluitans]|uniref:AMP-activated protein kinase glycogen-binding domain-containing protein n=1 Tax=Riccia fluitans TaxID=41844 RepID=A0ABD1YP98_9MARC
MQGSSYAAKCAKQLPRIWKGILPRTSRGEVESDCGVPKWVFRTQEKRLARLQIEATASTSAGRITVTAARRRNNSRKLEGSGGVNVDLELEILAFMLQSGKSDSFPTREELIKAGRQELVEAIVAEGGWLASGWEKKAKGSSHAGFGNQEVPHRPLTRQRALRHKSKVVTSSPRRPRGRPKLAERRSLPISASPGDNSEANEPTEKVDDHSSSSPRLYDISDGNTPEDSSTAVGRDEDHTSRISFKQIRKESGSKFPRSSAGYRLWEFESLAAFIEYRKFDVRKESVQRRQLGLRSTSPVRKKRSEFEAARRRHGKDLCKENFEAASERCKTGFTCGDLEEKVIVSAVKEDKRVTDKVELDSGLDGQKITKVEEAANAQAELKNATNDDQDSHVREAVSPQTLAATNINFEHDRGQDQPTVSETDVEVGITARQYTTIGEAVSPEALLETPVIVEKNRELDQVAISESDITVLQYPENPEAVFEIPSMVEDEMGQDQAEISRAEMDVATSTEQQGRVDEAVNLEPVSDAQTVVEQDRRVGEPVFSGVEMLDVSATTEQDNKVDEAIGSEIAVETPTVIESNRKIDEVGVYEAADNAGTGIKEETLNHEAELDRGPFIPQDTRLSKINSPQAELDTSTSVEAVDTLSVGSSGNTQASVTGVELDPLPDDERDTGAGKASVASGTLDEASTRERKVREIIVESEDKARKKKKTRKQVKLEKSEDVCKSPEKLSETLDWIHQLMEQREKEILEGNARSEEGALDMPKSIQDRIRSLENKLSATRTDLQSRRVALEENGDGQELSASPSDVHSNRLEKLRNASDELEFTENKILKLSSELRTTRRAVAALKGAQGIEIREDQNAAGENANKVEEAKSNLPSLRAARIVWPHPAQEVFLIGSFDGWVEKIKMELSGAGVFVVSMSLSPGRYEVKFIVDGTWRVDTERPIVYVGGYENNVLVIPEHFTLSRESRVVQ